MTTRAEAIAAAGEVLAYGEAAAAQMTPREQAEAAWESDDIATVEQLEERVRVLRSASRHRAAS